MKKPIKPNPPEKFILIVPFLVLLIGYTTYKISSNIGHNEFRSSVKSQKTEEPCQGYKDCSYEVRQKLEGAGWQLTGDVLYYGNGVHYAVGAKPMETGVKQIYYTMDCNCQPKDVEFK